LTALFLYKKYKNFIENKLGKAAKGESKFLRNESIISKLINVLKCIPRWTELFPGLDKI